MQITRPLATLACAVLAAFSHPAAAASGDLDLTFGGTGKVLTDLGSADVAQSIAVQSNGRIVVAGYAHIGTNEDFALARYNTNGSLDTSFNGTGKVTTDFGGGQDVGYSVVIQNDGKIVVAGSSAGNFALARYNANGSLDTSFNGTGTVLTDFSGGDDVGQSVVIQADGKIVVAGYARIGGSLLFALARYNANGSPDPAFGTFGKVNTAIGNTNDEGHSVTVQSDGKIVVAGSSFNGSNDDFALVRYNANGSLDMNFYGTGKVTTAIGSGDDQGYSVAVASDGKIVVAGTSYNGGKGNFAVVRYYDWGGLDTSFNGTGKVTTDFANSYDYGWSVALQSDGKIVVAGSFSSTNGGSSDFSLVRYTSIGSLDATFNGTGKMTTDFAASYDYGSSVALQSDGKIVVAGYSNSGGSYDFALARYEGGTDTDGDGIPDQYETGTGIYVSPTDTGTNPNKADTDDDGLNDGEEVNTYHSNPNIKDTDGDGFDDGFEVATGFSPTSAASTPDALSSIRTAAEYRFNAALGISYRIEASTDFTNWTTIETNIIGAGGVITRFYSIEGQPKRFFRSRRN